LLAVILVESGGRRIVTSERGGCSVGPGQVYINACNKARMMRLLELSTNLTASAQILQRSAIKCARHPRWRACRRSKFALYNSMSPTWWDKVSQAWNEITGKQNDS
jgi:hypothetical protein